MWSILASLLVCCSASLASLDNSVSLEPQGTYGNTYRSRFHSDYNVSCSRLRRAKNLPSLSATEQVVTTIHEFLDRFMLPTPNTRYSLAYKLSQAKKIWNSPTRRAVLMYRPTYAHRFAMGLVLNVQGRVDEMQKATHIELHEPEYETLKGYYKLIHKVLSQVTPDTPLDNVLHSTEFIHQLAKMFHSPDERECSCVSRILCFMGEDLTVQSRNSARVDNAISHLIIVVQRAFNDIQRGTEVAIRPIFGTLELLQTLLRSWRNTRHNELLRKVFVRQAIPLINRVGFGDFHTEYLKLAKQELSYSQVHDRGYFESITVRLFKRLGGPDVASDYERVACFFSLYKAHCTPLIIFSKILQHIQRSLSSESQREVLDSLAEEDIIVTGIARGMAVSWLNAWRTDEADDRTIWAVKRVLQVWNQ
ncbi:hypothetical protein PSACC_01862 [Paramicrosporidium saccamoebae]|uniref:Uncharacterized protein n=1 Tax=Paramicrosporidium saccamoebae TaxID=1246581 RepID=A0A2H9TKZ9_9FUNG|nr:hypothetical protein PSACC_01862 [Paramicrosporidium saccamoebae]